MNPYRGTDTTGQQVLDIELRRISHLVTRNDWEELAGAIEKGFPGVAVTVETHLPAIAVYLSGQPDQTQEAAYYLEEVAARRRPIWLPVWVTQVAP